MGRCAQMVVVAALMAVFAEGSSAQCAGDCNNDGRVSVDELVRGVNIALDRQSVSGCGVLDANADGRVSVSELVSAVSKSLGGCDGATPIPRTPTPTSTVVSNATATPIVPPGCNNGTVAGTFSNLANTNVDNSLAELTLVAAGQTRDPRSGRYLLAITGNTCESSGFARSIQIQIIGATTGFVVGSYAITPPLGSLAYLETPTGAIQPRIWNTTGATLVVESVNGGLVFRVDAAPMVPNLVVAGDPPPMGTFDLDISGTIQNVISN